MTDSISARVLVDTNILIYTEEVFKEFFREAVECGGALIAIDSNDGRVIGSSRFGR